MNVKNDKSCKMMLYDGAELKQDVINNIVVIVNMTAMQLSKNVWAIL